MKVIYINYSDTNFRRNQEMLVHHVRVNNIFDGVIPYTREWLLTKNFYIENKKILDKQRLGGYCIWKPYIILTAFESIQEGDVVVYMDCGDIPSTKLRKNVYDHMIRHDQYLLQQYPHNKNKHFTKRDCFYYMDCDEEKYWDTVQLEGGFMAWKRTERNVQILSEYLKCCTDERIVTDIPNQSGLDNFDGYVSHRHDQSIITNLQVKYDLSKVDGWLDNTGAGAFIKWNALYHKDGVEYSNGSKNWDENGVLK
jgi:hypothetical protein